MALIGLLVFVSIFLLVFTMARRLTETRLRVARRVNMMDPSPEPKSKPKKVGKLRAQNLKARFMDRLDSALSRGEMDVSPKDFLVRWSLVTFCVAIFAFIGAGLLAGLFFISISFFATFLYVQARGTRRLRRFEEGLHDMLTITANSLRAGYSFMQAIQVVSEDMHGPIQHELNRILAEMNVGVPLEEAFKSGAERMQSQDFSLIVTAILIQRQVGGNLAEVLDQISETIRERVRLKREVQVLTAQGRLSGWIFMFLPVGVGLMTYIISPSYVTILFQSAIGIGMLVFAFMAQLFGFLIIRKIVTIEA